MIPWWLWLGAGLGVAKAVSSSRVQTATIAEDLLPGMARTDPECDPRLPPALSVSVDADHDHETVTYLPQHSVAEIIGRGASWAPGSMLRVGTHAGDGHWHNFSLSRADLDALDTNGVVTLETTTSFYEVAGQDEPAQGDHTHRLTIRCQS